MAKLGYSYSKAMKTFYIDDHEKVEIFAYRNAFVRRYLLDYEPYMHLWI